MNINSNEKDSERKPANQIQGVSVDAGVFFSIPQIIVNSLNNLNVP